MTTEEMRAFMEREAQVIVQREMALLRPALETIVNDPRNVAPHPIKVAFDTHYTLYNVTTAFNLSLTTLPPRGSISMIDAGATPNRCIALYLSAGDKMVEIFAKVI